MNFVFGALFKLFSSSAMTSIGSFVKNLTDAQTAQLASKTGLAATETTALIDAEKARLNSVDQILLAMMKHPIWWFAWFLMVIPTALYDGIIHLKSVFCVFWTAACQWDIPRVPAIQEQWDFYVVFSFFGFAVLTGGIAAISSRLGKTG